MRRSSRPSTGAALATALLAGALLVTANACAKSDAQRPPNSPAGTSSNMGDMSQMEHMDHGTERGTNGSDTLQTTDDTTRPADALHVLARLNASPRHGQYVMVPRPSGDSMRAWVVYPERSSRAPVVVVIHEIFGLSTWVRGVADQLAQAGYIAIAPDLMNTPALHGAPDSVSMQDGIAAVSKLDPKQVMTDVDAAAKWGMAQPSALKKYGVIGFCWGGNMAFLYTAHAPDLGAAVVYYGQAIDPKSVPLVRAPVLGNYAGKDARVNTTIPPTDSAFKAQNKIFEYRIYDGAGHGFARAQTLENGANLKAIQAAWPATIGWFRHYLGT